jgi:hypothetical protein
MVSGESRSIVCKSARSVGPLLSRESEDPCVCNYQLYNIIYIRKSLAAALPLPQMTRLVVQTVR